jgi:EAL domain-containing protein (putative c-di-GMP-specific phosphodiesterase class I)
LTDLASSFNASFAFQPIVNIESRSVFAYEALVRGLNNEPAGTILGPLRGAALHQFDRAARIHAIRLAARLGIRCALSLNFLPQTLDTLTDAITSTIDAGRDCGIDPERLIIEVTEGEIIEDHKGFAGRISAFRPSGVKLAIDDFGAGYSGLNLLSEFQPDIVKLDMNLVRNVDTQGPRQAIARATLQVCNDLGLEVVCEGVETLEEFRWFRRHGVVLYQGYLIGRPTFAALGDPVIPTS